MLTRCLASAHVHLSELGCTEWTGTCAVISGGVATAACPPLNLRPSTTMVRHLEVKYAAACGSHSTDVAILSDQVVVLSLKWDARVLTAQAEAVDRLTLKHLLMLRRKAAIASSRAVST